MNNSIEVTFVFKDEDSFKKFVKQHANDEYTYRKGKYIVDMTAEIKQTSEDISNKVADVSPTDSMF